jgi:hypothetical protein
VLKKEFQFSSTDVATSVFELIRFYKEYNLNNVRKVLFDFVDYLDKNKTVDNIDDVRKELRKYLGVQK